MQTSVRTRASGGATAERLLLPSSDQPSQRCRGYAQAQGLLCQSNLLSKVLRTSRPSGSTPQRQVQKGKHSSGKARAPECGVVEVKPTGDDAWLTAEGDQVSKYWNKYRLVLVTNTRDFVLLGQDEAGRPAKLETFRLAQSAEEFESSLEKPRAFASKVGAGLGEYLSRALSHRATLVSSPKTWHGCSPLTPETAWHG